MPEFKNLNNFLESLNEKYGVPACECIVKQGHDTVYHRLFGFSDSEGTVPASSEDNYCFYSLSKLYTCTAVLQLIEQGRLRLDDYVSNYLPEFESMTVANESGTVPAESQITIFQLLSMTAGLNYNLGAPPITAVRERTGEKASTLDIVRAIAQIPLDFQPGAHYQYSLCHDVLGGVIEVVSGMKLSEYMEQNIWQPLGCSGLGYNSRKHDGKFSQIYCYDYDDCKTQAVELDNAFQLSDNYESGGAGMYGKAGEYARLPEALSCGGVSADGRRILSEESISLFRSDVLNDTQKADFKNMKPEVYSYGLGVRTRIKENEYGVPVGEFGWDGAAGSYYLIDPVNRISITYCEHILNHYCAYNDIQDGIRDNVYLDLGLAKK